MLTLESLRKRTQNGEQFDYLFFWGHTPAKDGSVTEGNIAKFTQNEALKQFLLATGTKVLVEASPYDRIWGIGLLADDPKASHPSTWQGENLLGFALMDVRDAIRSF